MTPVICYQEKRSLALLAIVLLAASYRVSEVLVG